MDRQYATGVLGGRFMPYDARCQSALETASRLCGRVCQMLLAGGVGEYAILRTLTPNRREPLTPAGRFARMKEAGDWLGNVETVFINIGACRATDGTEDAAAEAAMVRAACGQADVVFDFDSSYTEVFRLAYPEAEVVRITNTDAGSTKSDR